MNVIVVAGPLAPSIDLPSGLEDVESLVRPARPGEWATTGRCPTCSGTGVREFRRHLRCVSTCPTCSGSGSAEGVFLARVVEPEGSLAVMQFLAWAHEHRVRTDVKMALQDQRGPGWALAWRGLDGRPLRRWRDHLVAWEALAVFVDHADVHVAFHAIRDDGRIVVAGLWNVRVADDGAFVRTWSDRPARSLALRRRIRFPAEIVQRALQQAQASLAAARPTRCSLRPAHRPMPAPSLPAAPAAQIGPN